MIYTPLTKKAMRIAYYAHHGQEDKGGVPYIFHPIHLAEQMEDEITACIALLHDVAEDTEVTIDKLAEIFPPEVVNALKLLTHSRDVDYFDYIKAVKSDPLAKKVKLADIEHNLDETRTCEIEVLSTQGDEEFCRQQKIKRREKYKKAKEILTAK